MRLLSKILLNVSIAAYVVGCVPLVIGGGLAAGGYTAVRDKSLGDSLSDTRIEAAIKTRLYKISPQLYSLVSVISDGGSVLLTGVVPNQEWINIAERESWLVKGVISVDNNTRYGRAIGMSQTCKDGIITSKARSKILCCGDIRSINYKIKTMDGIVYLKGVAQSERELGLVLSKIQSIDGVRKIVSYADVKSGR
jgi:osmotically-inducible protein OsmY